MVDAEKARIRQDLERVMVEMDPETLVRPPAPNREPRSDGPTETGEQSVEGQQEPRLKIRLKLKRPSGGNSYRSG